MMKSHEDNKPAFVRRNPTVSGKEYAQLLTTLKQRYRKSQIKAAVKVNTEMLEFYWTMGRDISVLYAHATYGSAFFDCLSLDLKAEFPGQTGFSSANIRYAKRWYEFYNQKNTILHQVGKEFNSVDESNLQRTVEDSGMPSDFGLVPWGHHIDIFTRSKSIQEALFYIEETIKNNWSRPELDAEIEYDLYGKQGAAITNFDDKLPAPYNPIPTGVRSRIRICRPPNGIENNNNTYDEETVEE